jgi:pyruvate dehydrogenase E2 component (dihydrolipoamide acetyltransferase)
MPIEICLPELFESMTEGDLVAWLVAEGDKVQAGQVIAEVETDKSTLEIEAPETGTLVRILTPEGTRGIAVGQALAILVREGEALEEAEPVDGAELTSEAEADVPQQPEAVPETLRISPLARRMAAQAGLALGGFSGSGPDGCITATDVERSLGRDRTSPEPKPPLAAAPATREALADAPFVEEPVSRMRQTIARRLTSAKQEIPHFYLELDCDFEALLALRAGLNRQIGEPRIGVNDFAIKAAACALGDVPAANARWIEGTVRLYQRADVSFAVATEGGLVTPLLRAANEKSLAQISREAFELTARARAGTLRPEDYSGGSFTISNLGMYGVDALYAIINPPQSAILGIGRAIERPVVRQNQVVAAQVARLPLSVDHRVLDGALGARLLASIKERLEDPVGLLL